MAPIHLAKVMEYDRQGDYSEGICKSILNNSLLFFIYSHYFIYSPFMNSDQAFLINRVYEI